MEGPLGLPLLGDIVKDPEPSVEGVLIAHDGGGGIDVAPSVQEGDLSPVDLPPGALPLSHGSEEPFGVFKAGGQFDPEGPALQGEKLLGGELGEVRHPPVHLYPPAHVVLHQSRIRCSFPLGLIDGRHPEKLVLPGGQHSDKGRQEKGQRGPEQDPQLRLLLRKQGHEPRTAPESQQVALPEIEEGKGCLKLAVTILYLMAQGDSLVHTLLVQEVEALLQVVLR